MIDINTIFSACISSAVNDIVQPLRAHYDAHIESLRAEIEQLKAQREDGTTPNFTGQEVTALQLCITHETSPVYNAICRIARDVAVATAEEVMEEHREEYSHDEYDRIVNFVDDDLPDFDEFVKSDDLNDVIEEKLNSATIAFSL